MRRREFIAGLGGAAAWPVAPMRSDARRIVVGGACPHLPESLLTLTVRERRVSHHEAALGTLIRRRKLS
jgi:hypothetical protein